MRKKPVMLMILDGWGIAAPSASNAATLARTPRLDYLFNHYPHTSLLCSGEDVGLPDGQMGNSEVGHMNIGSGRIVYQELTRITKAIKDGDFFANKVLKEAMELAKKDGKKLHLLGLLSDGGVHSHIDHLCGLLKMAKAEGLTEVYVHAFLDGRDTPPSSALTYVEQLEKSMTEIGVGKIATVSGRYYAMDRDKRWERVVKAYEAMTSNDKSPAYPSAEEGIKANYAQNLTDEFVVPFRVEGALGKVEAGDSMICFNFRPDRARELTRAFVDEEFTGFPRNPESYPVHYVCMTQYDATIKAAVAFPPATLENTLGQVVAANGLKQLRIAETEKYAHVTFFFNGGVETPNPGEDRELIPSPKVATYDLQPEMSAYLVTEKLQELLEKDIYDLIILNFANPDMVGHTGNLPAAVKALEAVDECVGGIVETVRKMGGVVCITADHGNLEQMEDPKTHTPYTAHTTNPVPFIVVGMEEGTTLEQGRLADIAPTLLHLLELQVPSQMTGTCLIKK